MNETFIKLDYRCNNRCVFCSIGDKREFLDFEDYKKVIDIGKNHSGVLTLSGGEVTLRCDFIDILKYAKENGYSVINLQTNGRAFKDEEFTKEVASIGIDNYLISFHADTNILFENITKVSESFEETIAGIQMLKKYKQKIITNTVISKINYDKLSSIARLLLNLKVDAIKFVFVRAFGRAKENYEQYCPKFNDILPYLKEAVETIIGSKGINVMTEGIPFCLMRNYENVVGELYIPNQVIFNDPKYNLDSFSEYETSYHHKETCCTNCNFDNLCMGPWKEYYDLYGFSEFNPIKNVNPFDILPIETLVNKLINERR